MNPIYDLKSRLDIIIDLLLLNSESLDKLIALKDPYVSEGFLWEHVEGHAKKRAKIVERIQSLGKKERNA